MPNNPHGANQYQPDPRQSLFLAYYLDPKSETFSNAKQSAIKAGYSEDYADRILNEDLEWLSGNLRRSVMLQKAENNLNTLLDEEQDKRLRFDVSKFVAERVGKKDYSTRSELTGKDGEAIQGNTIIFKDFKDATTGE